MCDSDAMAVDDAITRFLVELSQAGVSEMSAGSVEAARANFRLVSELAARHRDGKSASDGDVAAVQIAIEDTTITADGRVLPIRIYRPLVADEVARRPTSRATVLYLHGGGHVVGDLDTHDAIVRRLVTDLGCVAVSLAYRLAPEHQWPAAIDDTVAAFQWVRERCHELGGDTDRIGIAGDSAGGNLAAAAAVWARDTATPLRAQLLIYPAIDFSIHGDYPSRFEFATGYFLTLQDMAWFGGTYAGRGAPVDDPRLSPIRADLTGVAPAVVVTAEFDPLRDEGDAFAAKLTECGVDASVIRATGMVHGFFDMTGVSAAADQFVSLALESFALRMQ